MIEIQNMSKSYNGNMVLNNLSWHIQQGDMWAITGTSGSGKSTLLNIIGMLETFDNGTVKIGGQAIPSPNSRSALLFRRKKVSYLFQNFGLIDEDTVYRNVELVLLHRRMSRKERYQCVLDQLRQLEIDALINKKVCELSGGQQQRVALARLFLKDSDIILADEPTGSLDIANRDMVMALLHQAHQQGKTIIIATHDEDILEQIPYVLTLGT